MRRLYPGCPLLLGSFALKVSDIRFDTMSRGGAGYASAKHGVVGLMRYYANSLAWVGSRCSFSEDGSALTCCDVWA
jgi:hypothetical protein